MNLLDQYTALKRGERGALRAASVNVCQCDVSERSMDPTNTTVVRRGFISQSTIRWNKLGVLLRGAVVTNDIFGLLPKNPNYILTIEAKAEAFVKWLKEAIGSTVLEDDGKWIAPFINAGYIRGQQEARRRVKDPITKAIVKHESFSRLHVIRAMSELRGIAAAVEQVVSRAFHNGLMQRAKPQMIFRSLVAQIQKVGVRRTSMLVQHSIINAYSEATLDEYVANDITQVSFIAENKPKTPTAQEMKDAISKKERRLIRLKSRGRVKRVPKKRPENWQEYERFQTAGDEAVCEICEELEGNVYLVDEARGLIPVHNNCRCVIVPHFDRRYRGEDD